MPRLSRKISPSGTYHVMLRGINKQTIFEDDHDRYRFIETVRRFKKVSKINIYGYCLMDNHIHMLLRESEESVSKFIQRLSASYVYWYNHKYDRYGHLFQDRFKSENVETPTSFFKVLRYIHQNPVKAGLATSVFECKWTSLHEYFGRVDLVEIEYGLELISSDRSKATEWLAEYMYADNDDQCLDENLRIRVPDYVVQDHLIQLGIKNNSLLQQMDKPGRNAIIAELKGLKGVSIRQIARVTGISKSVIERI